MLLVSTPEDYTNFTFLEDSDENNISLGRYLPQTVHLITEDQTGAEVQNSRPQNINVGEEIVLRVTAYNSTGTPALTNEQIEEEKAQIRWIMWVGDSLMTEERNENEETWENNVRYMENRDFIIIDNKAEQNDVDFDYTINLDNEEEDVLLYAANIQQYGYLYAIHGVVEINENGTTNTYNELRIKLSKWLEGKTVYIEAFRNHPDRSLTKESAPNQGSALNYVFSLNAQLANSEITRVYWESLDTQTIQSSGFNQTINLVVESLGLNDTNLDLTLLHEGQPVDTNSTDTLKVLPWSDATNIETINITERKTIIPYTIGNSAIYEDLFDLIPQFQWEDELNLKVRLSDPNPTSTLSLEDTYTSLNITESPKPINAFFARRVEVGNNITYEKIDRRYIGEEAYLVAECANMNGLDVTFQVFENQQMLVDANTSMPLLVTNTDNNWVSSTNIVATVNNGYAVRKIKFRDKEIDLPNTNDPNPAPNYFEDWMALLFTTDYTDANPVTTNGTFHDANLFIRVNYTIDNNTQNVSYLTNQGFKLRAAVLRYHIYYQSAEVSKNIIDNPVKANYIYHDKYGRIHNVCTCDVLKIDRRGSATRYANTPGNPPSDWNYPNDIPNGFIKVIEITTGSCRRIYHFADGHPHYGQAISSTSTGLTGGTKRRYPKINGRSAFIVHMPRYPFSYNNPAQGIQNVDGLNYFSESNNPNQEDTLIRFSYYRTEREYCNPDLFASFIGVLGEHNYIDVQCSGICFEDGTSHPSVSHNNGFSVDTKYFRDDFAIEIRGNANSATYDEDREEAFGKSFKKFHFLASKTRKGTLGIFDNLFGDARDGNHNHHYHCGSFNFQKVVLRND